MTWSRRNFLYGSASMLMAASLVSLGTPRARAENKPDLAAIKQSYPFYGRHQSGITTPQQSFASAVAFDCLAEDRQALERLFKRLTHRIRTLMEGGSVPQEHPRFPPLDSGILGEQIFPDSLTITVAVGASLFDDRYGLKDRKPGRLIQMERFPNDALDPSLCHGDIFLQLCAGHMETVLHALRDIVRNMPDLLAPRWKIDGFLPTLPEEGFLHNTPRNHLGFKDGTANPDPRDGALMDQLIWTQGLKDHEPAWTEGGSYQVVRLIRNFVERWDRTSLEEQEMIFGRHKYSGAPLGQSSEQALPDFVTQKDGIKTPLEAHIRRANPQDPHSIATRILRRGYNYSLGLRRSGQMDMGLVFICFQRDLDSGFRAIQARLNGEGLEEYIQPIGGGYFFVLPGVLDSESFLGQRMLSS